jgi:putative protease
VTSTHRIELLAPAGDERALRAALAAGADAVYFGLEQWSARAFAGNFAGDDAARAVALAHLYDARAHLALNTLLREDELEPAVAALEAPYLAGLDALIVADLGLAALVRERFPDLELHASTQLNTHSSAQLAALARLGFRRAILARELSLDEIAALDPHGLDLEAFVHGALCYGYSGDCLLSSMVGGRSGNRGRCSQSCRMRYRLSTGTRPAPPASGPSVRPDGRRPDSTDDDFTRVLSTGDLCAIGALPQLLRAGVTSFKIEGRMKDAAYVAVATAVYREALDAAVADPHGFIVRAHWMARLEQSFSRGFTSAHLDGRHDEVRGGGRGGHRGVLVGRVTAVDERRGEATVRLTKPVAAGDVVYLYTSWGQTDPVRVEAAATRQLRLRVRERVVVKDRLFRLSAAEVGELARDLVGGRMTLRPVRLRMCLIGEEGRPAALAVEPLVEATDARAAAVPDLTVTMVSAKPMVAARKVALDERRAREALGALGGTPYRLAELEVAVPDGLFLAVADLKDLRRRAVAALSERRLEARRRRSLPARRPASGAAPRRSAQPRGAAPGGDRDVILVLRPDESPASAPDVGALCLDLFADDPPDVVAEARDRLTRVGVPVRCRAPEILFDADLEWLAQVMALPWDAVYARHLGLAAVAPPAPASVWPASASLVLEYPLQGLNAATAAVVTRLTGDSPAAVVASPEMSLDQIAGLAAALLRLDPPPAVEALAFGRQQVLHARDRLGRAEGLVEAAGPAEHVDLLLEDAKGYVFPGQIDAGGTRLLNARVTNLAGHVGELREAGVARFVVVQRDLSREESRAFASGGLPALAAFATRERSTTGHLFRGVA